MRQAKAKEEISAFRGEDARSTAELDEGKESFRKAYTEEIEKVRKQLAEDTKKVVLILQQRTRNEEKKAGNLDTGNLDMGRERRYSTCPPQYPLFLSILLSFFYVLHVFLDLMVCIIYDTFSNIIFQGKEGEEEKMRPRVSIRRRNISTCMYPHAQSQRYNQAVKETEAAAENKLQ